MNTYTYTVFAARERSLGDSRKPPPSPFLFLLRVEVMEVAPRSVLNGAGCYLLRLAEGFRHPLNISINVG